MSDERLAEIEARANAATPGPWSASYQECGGYDCMTAAHSIGSGQAEVAVIDHALGTDAESDAAFIAASRTDVPALIAEIRRLRDQWEETEASRAFWEERAPLTE